MANQKNKSDSQFDKKISKRDISLLGFKFKIESDNIWHFEKGKEDKKLFLMYHPESGYLKLRRDWKWKYCAVIIDGLHIKMKDVLDFVISRLPNYLHLSPH